MKQQLLPSLSVFFPAYNEAGNIEEAVLQALRVLPKVAKKFEVLVINDGSSDATGQIARRLAQVFPQVRAINQKNCGYGGALKRGFKEAKYQWVFFTDADLQFDMEELRKLVSKTKSSDAVVGFRLKRAEGWKRQILARALKVWNRLLLGFPKQIVDIDCAFKLLSKQALRAVGPLNSEGAMISTELLLKLHRSDFRITQVGVHHYSRLHGSPTGNSIHVILNAMLDTIVLKAAFMNADGSRLLKTFRAQLASKFSAIPQVLFSTK